MELPGGSGVSSVAVYCVWEGVGTSVHLPTGAYTISLIGETDTGATVQPELLAFADR